MSAQTAPASPASTTATRITSGPGSRVSVKPAQAAANAPTYNEPSTPTLNIPERKAMAVARPVSRTGVAATSVLAISVGPPSDCCKSSQYVPAASRPEASRAGGASSSRTTSCASRSCPRRAPTSTNSSTWQRRSTSSSRALASLPGTARWGSIWAPPSAPRSSGLPPPMPSSPRDSVGPARSRFCSARRARRRARPRSSRRQGRTSRLLSVGTAPICCRASSAG